MLRKGEQFSAVEKTDRLRPLNDMLIAAVHRDPLKRWVTGSWGPDKLTWGLEPFLELAIKFAVEYAKSTKCSQGQFDMLKRASEAGVMSLRDANIEGIALLDESVRVESILEVCRLCMIFAGKIGKTDEFKAHLLSMFEDEVDLTMSVDVTDSESVMDEEAVEGTRADIEAFVEQIRAKISKQGY